MEIKAYGLNRHPDISSFFDDYGVEDSGALAAAFDKLADDCGGLKINAIEYYADGEQRIELHVLCDHDDDKTLRRAVAAYMAASVSHEARTRGTSEAVQNSDGWDPEMTPIKDLKKDQYFTINPVEEPKESQVWVFDGYDRSERKYYAYKFADVNTGRYFKGDKLVCTNIYF